MVDMDWSTIITALASTLIGGGGIWSIFYIGETKRAKRLEADASAAQEWQKLAERKLSIIEQKDAKIEELYQTIAQLRQDKDVLSSEVAVLRVYKCECIGCEQRKPPFGSVKLLKTAEL